MGVIYHKTKMSEWIYLSNSKNKCEKVRKITYSDPAVEGLAIFVKEGLLDVSEVDFWTTDDDSDECLVVGSQSLHWVVQALGEEANFALNAFH